MENEMDKKDCRPSDDRPRKVLRIIGMVFVGLIFAILFALVFGFPVKWLWNFLMPDLFGVKQITYYQAFAMIVLAKLLFGAFRSHHPHHRDMHPHPFRKWHDRFSFCDSVPWDKKIRLWKSYRQYWQDEGKEAFEAYIKKAQGEGNKEK